MKNFTKITTLEVLQLNSKSGAVFNGRITFKELLQIHRLTERKESSIDPFGEKTKSQIIDFEEEFQRHLNNSKLNQIGNYLDKALDNDSEGIIFPSSVILSLDLNEDNSEDLNENQINDLYYEGMSSCFAVKNDETTSIYIPKTKAICLIVDGQHRFYGLKKYYEQTTDDNLKKKISNFQFISTILLGYDSYQVAEVFANVNFNQKPVNKSLYYDIFGSAAKEKNEIQLAHFLALHMQNSFDSPLKDMIKLLGKGYGLFSQAFFVEKLLIHFKEGGVWHELYGNYILGGERFLIIAKFLKQYFRIIEEIYSACWPERVLKDGNEVYSAYSYKYILCKTTGMGALFRLIKDVYPLTEEIEDENKVSNILRSKFNLIDQQTAENLFSKMGEYGRGGSEGFQVRLYRELKERLELQ